MGKLLKTPWLPCLLYLFSGAKVSAGTELDFWHSYTHQPSGSIHFSFHIANYKRGLFFGSCGPSTRSLQWGFDLDLAGPGPVYSKDQITLTRDGKPVTIASGSINVDAKQDHATIRLQTCAAGTNQPAIPADFPGNGTHRIKKLRE